MSQEPLPSAQRNSPHGSALEGSGFLFDENQPHPGELLFKIEDLKDLVMKGDIPENQVQNIARMLWKAERYKITVLERQVYWYLLARLPVNRQSREEYIKVVVGEKKKEQEDDLLMK